jgi:transcriptional regulator with XRE-family HTH domain
MAKRVGSMHRYVGRVIHLIRKEKGMRQSELALLTGVKQPNLSRIENGLVAPRHATLERIAKAMGVDPQVFYSESKILEVERKWAASMGPRQSLARFAGRVISVPLYDTVKGYPLALNENGDPLGALETLLQIPTISGEPTGTRHFALRVMDDSMRGRGNDDFRPGDVVVFGSWPEIKTGDFAFLMLGGSALFRQLETIDATRYNLMPLNAEFPQRLVARTEITGLWRLVCHFRAF